MTDTNAQSLDRRLKLRVAIKLLIYMAVLAILYVFISAIRSNSDTVPDIPSMKVDVSDVGPGDIKYLSWEGRPILIYRRKSADLAQIRSHDNQLRDAGSESSMQPANAKNDYRSVNPQWFVAVASGTDLGCALELLPANSDAFQNTKWTGGFVDTCRKSRYDLAGRAFRGQYATRNLVVPVYSVEENIIILGRE